MIHKSLVLGKKKAARKAAFKIGSENHCSPEFYQPHRKIELFYNRKQAIYLEFAELYNNGLSLSDIAKQTGKSKSVIRASLLRDGIELRGNVAWSAPLELIQIM